MIYSLSTQGLKLLLDMNEAHGSSYCTNTLLSCVSAATQALFMRLWQCLYIGTDFIAMFCLFVTVFLQAALRGSQSRVRHSNALVSSGIYLFYYSYLRHLLTKSWYYPLHFFILMTVTWYTKRIGYSNPHKMPKQVNFL